MQISHLDVMLDLRQKLHARYIYQFLFLFFLSINIYFLPFLFCFLVLNTVSAPKSRPRPPVIKGVRRRRPPGRDTSTPTEVICINVTNTRRSSPTPSGRRLRRTLDEHPPRLVCSLLPCLHALQNGDLEPWFKLFWHYRKGYLTPMASGDQPPTTSMEPERCELDPNDGSYLYSGCSLSIFSWMKCQQRATRHNWAVGIETSTSLTLLLAMML